LPTRSYTAVAYGYSGSVRSNCDQVQLQLFEDGRFRLDALRCYSDWGDKTEIRSTWEGTWTEDAEGVACQAELQLQANRASDHESGLKRHECASYVDERLFHFPKASSTTLTCPLRSGELGGVFAGKPLGTKVEPHEKLFKSMKAKPAAGTAPRIAANATAKPAWQSE
jgi:hypothetical protein